MAAPAQRPDETIQDFHDPEKPPVRGCENPPKAFQRFFYQAAAIHRLYRDSVSVEFRTAAITAAGLTLRYLPRYSPDFSPIEPCWSKIKTALRAVAARTVESLEAALDTAVAEVTAEDAAGWFGQCGYTLAG